MSNLDDALANPVHSYKEPVFLVGWRRGTEVVDAGESFTVNHSLDDGLPEPVTATSGATGAGTLTVPDLTGQTPARLAAYGMRMITTEVSSAATLLNCRTPLDLKLHDFLLITVAFSGTVADIDPDDDVDETEWGNWDQGDGRIFIPQNLTGWTTDNGLTSATFGGPVTIPQMENGYFYTNIGFSTSRPVTITTTALWAIDGYGRELPIELAAGASRAESGTSVTSHAAPEVELTKRGIIINTWNWIGNNAIWTPPAGDTELSESFMATPANAPVQAISRTNVLLPGKYTRTATTAGGTSTNVMTAVALQFAEHDGMDARQYYSPFNTESQLYGEARDTADVRMLMSLITLNGPWESYLFTGQMADLVVKGRKAELTAISKTRMALMKSIRPPTIWGQREGLNATWLLSWATQECNLFISPPPSDMARIWIPGHGSMHDMLGYSGLFHSYRYDANGTNGLSRPPMIVDGPFLSAVYAEQNEDFCLEHDWHLQPLRGKHPRYGPTATSYQEWDDVLSTSNRKGRISMWVRGDNWTVNPTNYDVPTGNEQIDFYINLFDSSPYLNRAQIHCGIEHETGRAFMGMADGSYGTNITYFSNVAILPKDGEWHYLAFSWDYQTGSSRVRIDDTSWDFTSIPVNNATLSVVDTTEVDYEAAGNNVQVDLSVRLPVAEIMLETGYSTWFTEDNHRPDNFFTPDVIARPVDIEMEALAYPGSVEAYSIIQELAQASFSALHFNEYDQLMFLPLSYFGEAEQMTIAETISTETNSEEIDIRYDPTKIRNVVTVEFQETRADNAATRVLQYKTAEEIPRGTTIRTYPLDVPMVESWWDWNFDNLSAAQVTSNVYNSIEPFVTINANSEGTGEYYAFADVSAQVIATDSHNITVMFVNRTGSPKFLVNNSQDIPYLSFSGYAIRSTTGYATRRDETSVIRRNERALSSQLPIIQNRYDATQAASRLVAMMCNPRPELGMVALGNQERKPGELVEVLDPQGSKAIGAFRLLTVSHKRSGPQYTQELHAVAVGSPAMWDQGAGWDFEVWGE